MNRTWSGMQQVFIATNANVTVLGENHRRALGSASQLLDLLKTYTNGANLYIELSLQNDQEMRQPFPADRGVVQQHIDTAKSTIEGIFFYKLIHDVPTNVSFICCNQRSSPPFSIFYLMSNLPMFESVHALHILYPNPQDRRKFVRTCARSFEEAFTQFVQTRTDTMQFWRALVLPDVQEPEWYTRIVYETTKSIPTNYVKSVLQLLKQKDAVAYGHLIDTYQAFLSKLFDDSEAHSRLLGKLRRRVARRKHRQTTGVSLTPVIMRDAPKISDYFTYMQMFVQDVYMLAQYILNKDSAKPHIFLVGSFHCSFLVWFLREHFAMTFDMWEGKDIVTTTEAKKPAVIVLKRYVEDLETYLKDPSS